MNYIEFITNFQYYLEFSVEFVYPDWPIAEVSRVQNVYISLDGVTVNPVKLSLFGQGFMWSGVDQKLLTWEDVSNSATKIFG